MPKIIVIDVKKDRGGDIMRQMLDDGAFPDRLSSVLRDIIPEVFPMQESSGQREMWPGVGFPVSNPMHAIMNYLYATAQRSMVPPEIMSDMRREADNVMEISGGFDDDIKKEILSGSKKVYNRVLDDGTEIKIEITKPVKKEDFAEIDGLIKAAGHRKQAAADRAYDTMRVDLDKLGQVIDRASIFHPGKGFESDFDTVARKAASAVVIPVKGNEEWLGGFVHKVAEATGESEELIAKKLLAGKGSDNKKVVNGALVDSSRFGKYPFDSIENATKAIGKQAAELMCNESGNIDITKLKALESYGEEDPVLGRALDRIIPYIEWKDEGE